MNQCVGGRGIGGRAWCTLAACAGCLSVAQAQQAVTIGPSHDNTLFEFTDTDLSNGGGIHLFAGLTANVEPRQTRRALIRFDVSAAVPAGATITGARLKMTCSRSISEDEPVAIHRLTSAWGEGASDAAGQEGGGALAAPGDATWRHTFYPGSFWTTPGGDYVASASATTVVVLEGPYSWASAAMAGDVQSWLDDPATNFGWIIIGDETSLASAKRFDSREHPLTGNRPQLIIEYTVSACGSADFDGDGDTGTDADIEAFFACLGGNCCAACGTADFDGDGDTGTDADIEAFFRVLGGGNC